MRRPDSRHACPCHLFSPSTSAGPTGLPAPGMQPHLFKAPAQPALARHLKHRHLLLHPPFISTGSKGLPAAKTQLPSLHSYACCAVISALVVGLLQQRSGGAAARSARDAPAARAQQRGAAAAARDARHGRARSSTAARMRARARRPAGSRRACTACTAPATPHRSWHGMQARDDHGSHMQLALLSGIGCL